MRPHAHAHTHTITHTHIYTHTSLRPTARSCASFLHRWPTECCEDEWPGVRNEGGTASVVRTATRYGRKISYFRGLICCAHLFGMEVQPNDKSKHRGFGVGHVFDIHADACTHRDMMRRFSHRQLRFYSLSLYPSQLLRQSRDCTRPPPPPRSPSVKLSSPRPKIFTFSKFRRSFLNLDPRVPKKIGKVRKRMIQAPIFLPASRKKNGIIKDFGAGRTFLLAICIKLSHSLAFRNIN